MDKLSVPERTQLRQTLQTLGGPAAEPTTWPLVVGKDWKTKLANGNYAIHIVHPPPGIELPILDNINHIKTTVTDTYPDGAEIRLIEVSEKDVGTIESRLQGPEEQGMFPDC
jgi:hypothetical protein